jgi:hypothetical protein
MVEGWRAVAGMLSFGGERGAIDSLDALERFVATRAAFVAQKSLYGYLKTRIGTRYPTVFEDPPFLASINIAKFQVFAACLADLAIFAVAEGFARQAVPAGERARIALGCYRRGLEDNQEQMPPAFSPEAGLAAFEARLAGTDWAFGARQRENFRESPMALFDWAPIAPELKDRDREIVENSIRFEWREIREQYKKRLDAGALLLDWRHRREPALSDQGQGAAG